MRVLILDNDPEQRKGLRSNLEGLEFEVVDMSGGEAALDALNEELIDIVVAEFDMPTFSGIDLVNGMLAADLQKTPYLILLVRADGQRAAVDCLGPLPGDYLVRPFSEEDLKAKLAMAERSMAFLARMREQQGDESALYDPLTGVLNKQAVYERALAEVNRAQREQVPVSIAMAEIHNLTEIGEKHGLETSDQAMRYVARAARANLRLYDLVGRWVGMKFLLVLPGASRENIETVMERVDKSIATIRLRVPDGDHLQLDVRFGAVAKGKEETLQLYEIVEQANEALMKASRGEDGRIVIFGGRNGRSPTSQEKEGKETKELKDRRRADD